MPTPHQIKKIATKTAITTVGDKFVYKEEIKGAQVFKDVVNFALTEYATLPWLTNATSGMMQSMDPVQHSLLMEVGINVLQDMLMQKFAGGESRSLVHDIVIFGVASVGTQQLQSRIEMLN